MGFLTLVTGSKFYCGPPFCGAVLFPPAALAELEAGHEHLPAGFKDYFTRHEVREHRCSLQIHFFNFGGFPLHRSPRPPDVLLYAEPAQLKSEALLNSDNNVQCFREVVLYALLEPAAYLQYPLPQAPKHVSYFSCRPNTLPRKTRCPQNSRFVPVQVDSRYSTLRSCLPDWENRGLLLRWASALTNMEAVKSIPEKDLNTFIGR